MCGFDDDDDENYDDNGDIDYDGNIDDDDGNYRVFFNWYPP